MDIFYPFYLSLRKIKLYTRKEGKSHQLEKIQFHQNFQHVENVIKNNKSYEHIVFMNYLSSDDNVV